MDKAAHALAVSLASTSVGCTHTPSGSELKHARVAADYKASLAGAEVKNALRKAHDILDREAFDRAPRLTPEQARAALAVQDQAAAQEATRDAAREAVRDIDAGAVEAGMRAGEPR